MNEADVAALTNRWRSLVPQCPPVGFLLRHYLSDRWVRFHTLPGSKRYPDDEAEYQIILDRHNTLLSELGADLTYVATMVYAVDDLAAGTEPVYRGTHRDAVPWMTVPDPIEEETTYSIRVSRHRYQPGSLDQLLRQIADDQAPGVVLAADDLSWLYCPYDGGADVILPTWRERDAFKARHREWLSTHPRGL